jgi:hypothetical protein
MHHPRLDVDLNMLLTQVRLAKGSEMSGRGQTEPEHLPVLTPVDHLLDYPSTDKVDTINPHDFLLILETILDMEKSNKFLLLRNIPLILDMILDKATEWMLGVRRSSVTILELIRLRHLLLVELPPKGSRKRMSLGQLRRRLGTKVASHRARSLAQMAMGKAVLPIDLSTRVSKLYLWLAAYLIIQTTMMVQVL